MLVSPRLQRNLTTGLRSSIPGRLIASVSAVGKYHPWLHPSVPRDITVVLSGGRQLYSCVSPFSARLMCVKLWLPFPPIQHINDRRRWPSVVWGLFSSGGTGEEGFYRGNLSWLRLEKWVLRARLEAAHEMARGRAMSPGIERWGGVTRQDALKWLLEVIFKVIFFLNCAT